MYPPMIIAIPMEVVNIPNPRPNYWSLFTIRIKVPCCAETVPGTNPYSAPANSKAY